MKAFTYERANSLAQAAAGTTKPGAKIIAGGTNLLDLDEACRSRRPPISSISIVFR